MDIFFDYREIINDSLLEDLDENIKSYAKVFHPSNFFNDLDKNS